VRQIFLFCAFSFSFFEKKALHITNSVYFLRCKEAEGLTDEAKYKEALSIIKGEERVNNNIVK